MKLSARQLNIETEWINQGNYLKKSKVDLGIRVPKN